MDSKSVGFLVFGLAMVAWGYVPCRFPWVRRSMGMQLNRGKPVTAAAQNYNRGLGIAVMVAGSALVTSSILVIR